MTVLDGWRSTQDVAPDGAIDSEQRALLPRRVVDMSVEGAARLGDSYWREVAALTAGVVQLRAARTGPELRALGIVLLSFDRAQYRVSDDEVTCTFMIRGGVLTRRPSGALTLSQRSDPPEIRSTISAFVPRLSERPGGPRWTGALYSQVEQRIHVSVSRRFFRRLIEDVNA